MFVNNLIIVTRLCLQALGGGYLHWGHMEMMRLTINRRIDPSTTFALWRFRAPHKPITRKGLGQRMGGGKGAIDHYVTPVKCGRLVVEVGGRVELGEVEAVLTEVAKKLPFPAKVCSSQQLQFHPHNFLLMLFHNRLFLQKYVAIMRKLLSNVYGEHAVYLVLLILW